MAYFRSVKRRRVGTRRIRRRPRGMKARPLRRGRRRISRKRSGRRAFGRPLTCQLVADEGSVSLTTAAPTHIDKLNFAYATIPANPALARQIAGYGLIFDQVKCTRATITFWLKESSEETLATYIMPHMRVAYDPDMNNRTVPWDSISNLPNCKDVFLRPGSKYTFGFTPLFRENYTDGALGKQIVYRTTAPWCDAANMDVNTMICSNGLLINTFGGPVTLMTKVKYTLRFKQRKNGILYTA